MSRVDQIQLGSKFKLGEEQCHQLMLCSKFQRFFNATTTVQDWLWAYSSFQSLHNTFFITSPCPDILPYLSTRSKGRTCLTNRQLPMKAGWLHAPPTLQDLGVRNLHYCYSEQSVCNLIKRMTRQLVFSGEIFDNGWFQTATTKLSEIIACDAIQFLIMKISFRIPL